VPILVGIAAAVIAAGVAWQLVRHGVGRWSVAFSVGPELRFVVFFGGFAGLTGFYLARRLLRGARVAGSGRSSPTCSRDSKHEGTE
jgi:hypothetical protein